MMDVFDGAAAVIQALPRAGGTFYQPLELRELNTQAGCIEVALENRDIFLHLCNPISKQF